MKKRISEYEILEAQFTYDSLSCFSDKKQQQQPCLPLKHTQIKIQYMMLTAGAVRKHGD